MDDLLRFAAANAHLTTADLLEQARREAERDGKVIKTSPRPGKAGVDARRFEVDDDHYLWVAQHGNREVRRLVRGDDLLHAEFRDNWLALVDDRDVVWAAIA